MPDKGHKFKPACKSQATSNSLTNKHVSAEAQMHGRYNLTKAVEPGQLSDEHEMSDKLQIGYSIVLTRKQLVSTAR